MGLAAKLNVADRQASRRLSKSGRWLKKSVYGREVASLARTYAALGVNFKSQHLPTFDFLAAIRDEIGKSENANSTHEIVQAYTEVVSLLKDQDVEGQDVQEFSALRSAIANEQTSFQLAALAQAYTALAAEFKDPDPQAAGITPIVLAAIARSAHSHDIAGQLHGILSSRQRTWRSPLLSGTQIIRRCSMFFPRYTRRSKIAWQKTIATILRKPIKQWSRC